MRNQSRRASALAPCLLVLLPVSAGAGPKRLPARTVVCGEVITQSLRVANPLLDCPAGGLIVGAPGITIDLGGHRIEGAGTDTGISNSIGHDGVTIRNGIVSDFSHGVLLEDASANLLESLALVGNEVSVRLIRSSASTIRGVSARDSGEGIRIENDSDGNALVANDASHNATTGIRIVESSGNVLTGNRATANGTLGFEIQLSPATVARSNTARGNIENGIFVHGESGDILLKGNTSSANGLNGILIQTDGVVLLRNTTDENGVGGIISENVVTVRGNRSSRNGFLGGGAGDDNGLGIFVAEGSISSGNKASGNDDPNECVSDGVPANVDCHVP